MIGEALPWLDANRYRLVRRIGDGGMGVVYEVEDRERGKVVALKTVLLPNAEALYRTKQEFRAIADLEHPNLVRLYDLTVENENCFFTMELVPGVDFLRHCSNDGDGEGPRYDEARLRLALGQVARGLHVLHTAGKVHRDVKPSNVLVTDEGRVVLLDFGLARDMRTGALESVGNDVVGTAAYMSPEQARGERELTPATDWYALGVMLHQTLTGRLPFEGRVLELLLAKQSREPTPPSEVDPRCPKDLDQLCVDLLRRAPAERPAGEEILARLGLSRADTSSVSLSSSVPEDGFVGREAELQALAQAADLVRAGRTVLALVHGPSGMGKTTLVQRFLASLRPREEVLVFGGRCYPQESIPYKAVDGVVDGLSRHLRRLRAKEVQELLPDGVEALARLFPVLRRVKAIAARHTRTLPDDVHPTDARLRAFRCLRELLDKLARQKLLVLVIDDVQWGDSDSATLLVDLLRGVPPMPVLLIASSRHAAADKLPVLTALERLSRPEVERVRIPVGPLSQELAARAAARLLGRPGDVLATDILQIVREAAGSPLMLGELALTTRAPGDVPAGDPSADGLIVTRLDTLASAARRLVEVVALAERPLPTAVALRAAGCDEGDRLVVHKTRAGHWLRSLALGGEDCLDTFHDRVREAVIGTLSDSECRRLHVRLGSALEACENPPVDRLAHHLARGGETERACHYARRAAKEATAALAFDRAVAQYELAVSLASPEARPGLLPELARALSHAGRTSEAAEVHLTVAEKAEGAERLEHRRLAADNLLRCGHIDRALELLREVAGELGIPLGEHGKTTLLKLVWRRVRLAMRGLGYAARRSDELSERTLKRLDTLGTLATTVVVADPLRGMIVQASYVREVLDAGEETRICRALAAETAVHAMLDDDARASRIAQRVTEIAERLQTPEAFSWCKLALALRDHGAYRFGDAAQHYAEAQQLFHQVPTVTQWELTTARLYRYFCAQHFLGYYRSAAHDLEDVIEDARRRNDLHAQAVFSSTPLVYLRLAQDRPEDALTGLHHALDGWPTDTYYLMHYYVDQATALVEQYMGRIDEAMERALRAHRQATAAGLLRVPIIIQGGRRMVGTAALAAGRSDLVETHMRPLLRSRHPAEQGLGHMFFASVCAQRGDPEGARARLEAAVPLLEVGGVRAWLAAARYRLARLSSGDEARALDNQASAWLTSEAVAAPERMMSILCPWSARRQP